MKHQETEAEYANKKIEQYLDGKNETEKVDVQPLINNNNIALVIKEQKKDHL